MSRGLGNLFNYLLQYLCKKDCCKGDPVAFLFLCRRTGVQEFSDSILLSVLSELDGCSLSNVLANSENVKLSMSKPSSGGLEEILT